MKSSQSTNLLLRLSAELSTKASGTRRRFMRKLVENLREALRSTGADFHVESQWTRVFVRTTASEEALRRLGHIPGISSYSVVIARCGATLDEIVRTGVEIFGERVKGRTYAVRARRTGTHSFRSGDLMHALGAALNPGARVDLTDPEVEVEVEVREEEAYFFSGREPGFGGLPLGVEGRAMCLLSGGFDSAVAAWLMLKRGVELDYVFCNLGGDAYERSVAQVGKILADEWSFGTRPRLYVVPFAEVLDDLRDRTDPRLWQLVLKRLMYRAAALIARETRGQVLITGDAIGQVSSQTLSNLAAIDRSSPLPVFRPLIGFDKMDIVEMSRRVGTFGRSSKIREYCAIAPGNPATSATARQVELEEEKLTRSVLEQAVERRRVLNLRALTASDLMLDYVFTDEVPGDALVLDLRTEPEREEWHVPGSIHRDSWDLDANARALDPKRTYVIHCSQGTQAAQVAEALQREGFDAYAFRGGTRALRRKVEGSPPGGAGDQGGAHSPG
jgi:tRNA uracil 4-sulfurtransferase